jgi:hypothetical protein
MTMIDEEALRVALQDAANLIPIPDGAADQILFEAQRLDARRRAAHRFWRRPDVRADVAGFAKEAPPENGPRDLKWKEHRPRRRMLVVVATVIIVLGIGVAAATSLGGSKTSDLAAPPAHSASRSPVRSAAPGPLGFATAGGAEAQSPVPSTTPTLPTGAVGGSSKVEETGSVDLTVGEGRLEPVLTRLTNLATGQGGFVASTQTQSGQGASTSLSSGSITLQVPEASFALVVAEAQTFGRVTALTTKGTDVTGQYVDLQARIAALEASRNQYLTIMSKASSIGDILAVQAQLDALQTQLEQLQGQLQVLDSETTYGTLVVSVSERGSHATPAHHTQSGIASAWHGAINGFSAAFDGLIRIAGPALFALLCLVAFALFARLAWRAVRRRTL